MNIISVKNNLDRFQARIDSAIEVSDLVQIKFDLLRFTQKIELSGNREAKKYAMIHCEGLSKRISEVMSEKKTITSLRFPLNQY
jgi:hypothetical protein